MEDGDDLIAVSNVLNSAEENQRTVRDMPATTVTENIIGDVGRQVVK